MSLDGVLFFFFLITDRWLFLFLIPPFQVSDFYKRPILESPAKAAVEETSHLFEDRGIQLLGQIKFGSCRPRAILFKSLADTVGLESRLMVVSLELDFIY